ncbi:MAG: hypothetical protein HY721_14470 [Planctomycetes bacterium]|nr:hypothetical protein [Planctomycetota bacterium]
MRFRGILRAGFLSLVLGGSGGGPRAAGAADAAKGLPIPKGPEPAPVAIPHFPRRLDAFVFRSWGAAPPARIARAIGATEEQVRGLARDLGLGDAPEVTQEAFRRSAITIIRRSWHLLPYPQLLELLGWSEGELGYALREDDFLWIKLGGLKPRCEPIRWEEPDAAARERHAEIRKVVEDALGGRALATFERRFAFLEELRAPVAPAPRPRRAERPEGAVDLSTGWSLAAPPAASEGLRGAAGRLRAGLERLGARLAAEPAPAGSPTIAFGDGLPSPGRPESHEVRIAPGRVAVSAEDDMGFHRAVELVLSRCERAGGPWLEPGTVRREARFGVRFLYSYFALYGDALLEPGLDPSPDGYLERLARLGVNGVWLPVLLRNVAPSESLGLVPRDGGAAEEREARLRALGALVERAARFGIGVYLYLNEPRAMPLEWFAGREGLRGVVEGDAASLCTSVPEVLAWLGASVEHLCRRVPRLAGLFTITASENLTSCWSHQRGRDCPRCSGRAPADVLAEVNAAVARGARAAGSRARVIAWDWGWPDDWIQQVIERLPEGVAVMSVSEWSLPIRRGGVETTVGEYSISAVGPGPRARRTWQLANARGLEAIAKVQAGNTWELSATPYIPAVRLVAEHARRLSEAGVGGVMLGWTLGGYPSPNLEAFGRYAFSSWTNGVADPLPQVDHVLESVAAGRFGELGSPGPVAQAWTGMSDAFRELPYHAASIYRAPFQTGPANLLHAEPSGYASTMVGFPYDDLDGWRAAYPPEVYAGQLERVAQGWREAMERLRAAARVAPRESSLAAELRVAEAALLHFASAAQQARFVMARARHRDAAARKDRAAALAALGDMDRIAGDEEAAARALLAVVREDSRIGFEATNHYYYLPADLLEKAVSCRWIRDVWVPREREGAGK